MNNCTLQEVKKVASIANREFMRNRGRPMEASVLVSKIEGALDLEAGTFDLASHISGENNPLKTIVEKLGIDTKQLLNTFNGKSMAKTNVAIDVTSYNTDDLFHSIPAAKKFFTDRTNRQVVNMSYIGLPSADTYVNSNETVSKNMQILKNDLFLNIQSFLISNNSLEGIDTPRNLFDENYNAPSLEYYTRVMSAASKYFFGGTFEMSTSPAGKQVPNISKDTKITDSVYEAYSDLVFLNNFDTVINNDFGHRLKINGKFLDSLEGSPTHDKYYVKSDAKSTEY